MVGSLFRSWDLEGWQSAAVATDCQGEDYVRRGRFSVDRSVVRTDRSRAPSRPLTTTAHALLGKLATLLAIGAEPVSGPGEELPRMTLRQGLIGTDAQLRWAEDVLTELRARAARHPALA